MVVKNSLAARAMEGTPLAPMFEGLTGTSAVCWGGEDIVSLAKEVSGLAKDKQYEAFETRGGVMEGENLSAQQVAEVSKWPTREEQLSLLTGQILGPGARLASQLTGPGSALWRARLLKRARATKRARSEGSGESGAFEQNLWRSDVVRRPTGKGGRVTRVAPVGPGEKSKHGARPGGRESVGSLPGTGTRKTIQHLIRSPRCFSIPAIGYPPQRKVSRKDD